MSYTNLSNNPEYLWNQVSPMLDKYATFRWDNEDMTLYHAFIINEKKGSLKFYNGPSFSNNYTQSQFESASSKFTGVTFKTQQISFTIAVYAVTAEQYRRLINKLHPYVIGNLSFGFDRDWRYVCKLSNISDSDRYIVGHYNDNNITKELYYTELKLTFDIVGDAVAQSTQEIGFLPPFSSAQLSSPIILHHNLNDLTSELDTPFLFTFTVSPKDDLNPELSLSINDINQTNSELLSINNTITLFKMVLQNLTPGHNYTFEYNSQTGDLCLLVGNDRKIITLLTTYSSGKRIISSITTNKMMLPGSFDGYNWERIKIIIYYQNCNINLNASEGYGINCYARTNLI